MEVGPLQVLRGNEARCLHGIRVSVLVSIRAVRSKWISEHAFGPGRYLNIALTGIGCIAGPCTLINIGCTSTVHN